MTIIVSMALLRANASTTENSCEGRMKLLSVSILILMAVVHSTLQANEETDRSSFHFKGDRYRLAVEVTSKRIPSELGYKVSLRAEYELLRLNKHSGVFENVPGVGTKTTTQEFTVAIDSKGRLKFLGGGTNSSSGKVGFDDLHFSTRSVIEPVNNTTATGPMRVTVRASASVIEKQKLKILQTLGTSESLLAWDFSKTEDGRMELKQVVGDE